MSLVKIYQCLCEPTRLRILNLLAEGPLCVCHFQQVLGESQVKVSKHLAYLKARGMVEARRDGQWVIYRLPARPSRPLRANLACLQDCAQEDPTFRRDTGRLRRARDKFCASSPLCCAPRTKTAASRSP